MQYLIFDTKPKIIKTKISVVLFKLIFCIPKNLKEDIYLKLLDYIICTTNNFFPNQNDHKKEIRKKLILSISLETFTKGNNRFVSYNFTIPKAGIIKDYDFEESFKFAISNLFNPYVFNEQFNLEKFNYEKNYFIELEKNKLNNINGKNSNELFKIIDLEQKMFLSHETKLDILINSDPKTLYSLYKKHFLNSNFFSLVYGDVSNENINKLFDKYLPQKTNTIKVVKNYYDFKKLLGYKEINNITNFNQTEVDMVYQIENMKVEDIHYFNIIYYILQTNENDLLMNKLRGELNLVYDAYVTRFQTYGMYIITAYTQLKNKDKVIDAINKLFVELKNIKLIEVCLQKLLKALEDDLLIEEDDPYNLLSCEINKLFEIENTQEIINIYKNIKVEDIINFIEQIKLTQVVCFEGVDNNEYRQ